MKTCDSGKQGFHNNKLRTVCTLFLNGFVLQVSVKYRLCTCILLSAICKWCNYTSSSSIFWIEIKHSSSSSSINLYC